MQQTMTVTQTENQLEVETRLIQPDNEANVKDTFVFDGKEHEFTPQRRKRSAKTPHRPKAKGQPAWLPDGSGIVVKRSGDDRNAKGIGNDAGNEEVDFYGDGELTIALYVDGQTARTKLNGSL